MIALKIVGIIYGVCLIVGIPWMWWEMRHAEEMPHDPAETKAP